MKWKIEYDNDSNNDGAFREWWNVTNEKEIRFTCTSEENANWLCNRLNSEDVNPSPSGSEAWVSVEDRLPEVDERVLCAKVGDFFTDIYTYTKSGFMGWSYPHIEPSVTHWQPLPQPPIK